MRARRGAGLRRRLDSRLAIDFPGDVHPARRLRGRHGARAFDDRGHEPGHAPHPSSRPRSPLWTSLRRACSRRDRQGRHLAPTIGRKPPRLAEFEARSPTCAAFSSRPATRSLGAAPASDLLTASGPKALRLAGRIGDGVLFQVGAHPQLIAYALREIDVGGARGRSAPLDDLCLCARVACAVGDDRDDRVGGARGVPRFALQTIRYRRSGGRAARRSSGRCRADSRSGDCRAAG